jgi:hypothetical protein
MIVLGVVAAGPWITYAVGSLTARLNRGPGALLAGRRLQDNPAAGFRAVSGLVLAVFAATLIAGVFPAMGRLVEGARPLPGDVLALNLTNRDGAPAPAWVATKASAAAAAVPGARRVARLRLPAATSHRWQGKADTALAAVVIPCADLLAFHAADCRDPRAIVDADAAYLGQGLFAGTAEPHVPRLTAAAFEALPSAAVLVGTDGDPRTLERLRTVLERAYPAAYDTPATAAELYANANPRLANLEKVSDAGLILTLLIAACSLATSVGGGLVERRRPLALLRLAGVQRRHLVRMLLAETAFPLLAVSALSVALGLSISALLLRLSVDAPPWRLPDMTYWLSLTGGLVLALVIAALPLSLLMRLTSPQSVRFE